MRFTGSGNSGTFDWLFQRVSGAVLVILLGIHFIVLHYTGSGVVTYDAVAPRLADPYYKALQLLFLTLGLYHAMNGIKMVADDYVHSQGWRTLIISALWVVTLAFGIFGALTVLTFAYQPS